MGGFGWEITTGFGDPGADWPGISGLGEGWVGVTSSNPDWSDSMSDPEIGRSFIDAWFVIASFAGNRVSSNFTSREISICRWAASQNWYPLDPDS